MSAGEKKVVSCGGDEKFSGHPKIYLNMGEKDSIVCPYCSRKFTSDKKSEVFGKA